MRRKSNEPGFAKIFSLCLLVVGCACLLWRCSPTPQTDKRPSSNPVTPATQPEKVPAAAAKSADQFDAASKLPIRGFFTQAAGKILPENWLPESASDAAGKIEIIDEMMVTPVKAVKLTAADKPVLVQTVESYPVITGDCILVRGFFKGTGFAGFGYNGYDAANNKIATGNQAFKTYWADWDCRSRVFEIVDPKIATIRIFFSAPADTTMSFCKIEAQKLSAEEGKLVSPKTNRELWRNRIQGVNLAAGKKVIFDPKPNYELTVKGDSDETDLTDGKLGKENDMLWFDEEAVAWFRAYDGVTIMVDLGEVQPVSKAVIRINGGRLEGTNFPKKLEAWISKDGKNFYPSAAMTKVAATEYYLSDWKSLYYLPESEETVGTHYVYPFELAVNADARYVAVRAPVYTGLMMICDELAVIKSEEKTEGYNSAYQKQPEMITHQTSIVRPRLDKFYIADNVQVPNWLRLDDRRPSKDGKFGYIIDLPESIEFTEEKSYPAFTRTLVKTETVNGRKRLHFVPDTKWETFSMVMKYGFGPFFFYATNKNLPDNEKYVAFTTTVDGKEQHAHRSPLEIISIPEVPQMKELNVSLAWTDNRHSANWPDYLRAQRHLGFNTIPFFPFSRDAETYRKVYDEAVKTGFSIRMQMSPTATLRIWYPDIDEYKCVGVTRKTGKVSACPAYRGKYYQEMLDKITETVKNYPAGYITFDEESWEPTQLNESMKCSRCEELRKSKGMEWKEYLDWVQADYLKGFKEAVARGSVGREMPVIGYYALNPNVMHHYGCAVGKIPFLGYSYLFPKWSDEIQPSHYGNNPRVVHEKFRICFKHVDSPRQMIPWLTGGSGAYCETIVMHTLEQEILESFMNGAGGLQYFAYRSLESPIDYFYHASALSKIAPYENILMKGKLLELTGSNGSLLYTARQQGSETLLLIGNYGTMSAAETTVKLPLNRITRILDLNTGQPLPATNPLVVKVPADGFALLHIQ
jgi:hypothetical protein